MVNITQLDSSASDKHGDSVELASTKTQTGRNFSITQIEGSGLDKHFKIHIPANVIVEKINKEIISLTQTVNLPGFRKFKSGTSSYSAAMKAKERKIRSKYEESIANDVRKEEVIAAVDYIIKSNNFSLVDNPDITVDNSNQGDANASHDLVVDLKFTVFPEIQTPDFSQITLEKHIVQVKDEEIDQQIANLYKIAYKYQDRADKEKAVKGDKVTLDININCEDKDYSDKNVDVVLGDKKTINEVEEKIVGATIGDKVVLNIKLPNEYAIKEIAGKEVDIHSTVKRIQFPIFVQNEEELLKLHKVSTIDELKNNIRESMNSRFQNLSYMLLKARLLNHLDQVLNYDLPKPLLRTEYQIVRRNIENALKDPNNNHIKSALHEDSEQDVESYCQFLSARRVRTGLFVFHYSEEKNIKVNTDDAKSALSTYLSQNPQEAQKILKSGKESLQSLLNSFIIESTEVRVIDHILNNEVKLVEQQCTAEDLQQLADVIGDEIKILADDVSKNITSNLAIKSEEAVTEVPANQ